MLAHCVKTIRISGLAAILATVTAACLPSGALAQGTEGPLDYIIINHVSLEGPAMNDFLALKTDQGFSFVRHSVSNGVSRDSILKIVENVYFSHYYCPTYLLLIGSAKRDAATENDAVSGTPSDNLIPTFYQVDHFGHRTGYDQWYGYMWPFDAEWRIPRMIVARIPARNTTELQNYVAKLESYDADVGDAPWKRRVLLMAGDTSRGPWPGFPSPALVNSRINELNNSLPTGFTGTIVRHSSYASYAQREQAFVEAVNLGQGLIAALTTGSHANTIGWIVDRIAGFDARTDLSNSGLYPVYIGASCNLAQFDVDFATNDGALAENLLFAPSRGVIGIVGPTGFSEEYADAAYLSGIFDRVFNRGVIGLGNLNGGWQGADTYAMTSVLGDPSLVVPFRLHGLQNRTFSSGMELSDPLPLQNHPYSLGGGVEHPRAGVINCDAWMREVLEGRRSYCIDGYDNANPNPTGYWTLYDNQGLALNLSRRFLTFEIKALEHPEDVGRFSVQCVVDGQLLNPIVKDQFGIPIGPSWRNTPLGRWKFYAFDLQSQYGKTLDKVLVGYSASDYTKTGSFAAVFDDIQLVPEWGYPPDVGLIQMPSLVLKGSSVDVSLGAEDPDDLMFGDPLSVQWSTSYGSITGTGFSVVYNAPSQVGYSRTVTATVTDKGGHTVVREKQFDVVAELPGCPHLFVWDGSKYLNQGAVLTRSRIYDSISLVVDALPILTKPALLRNRTIQFALREDGEDKTTLDSVSVTLVRLEPDSVGTVGMTPEGRVLGMLDPTPPEQCRFYEGVYHVEDFGEGGDGPPGYDQLDKVRAADRKMFRAYVPGYLTLWYDADRLLGTLNKPGAACTDGGGPGIPPPEKEPDKIAVVPVDSAVPNYVSITVWVPQEGWKQVEVARVAPHSTFRLPQLVDLLPYVDPRDGLSVRISWTRNFSVDDLSFYRFSTAGIRASRPRLAGATHTRIGLVTGNVSRMDEASVVLEPGEELTLTFDSLTMEPYDLGIIILRGKYEPSTKPHAATADAFSTQAEIVLLQNAPNPFNDGTVISYSLAKGANVRLEVFDLLGRKIRTLVDGPQEAGPHTVHWDTRDAEGQRVSSGVYFYRASAGNASQSKKMIVVR